MGDTGRGETRGAARGVGEEQRGFGQFQFQFFFVTEILDVNLSEHMKSLNGASNGNNAQEKQEFQTWIRQFIRRTTYNVA